MGAGRVPRRKEGPVTGTVVVKERARVELGFEGWCEVSQPAGEQGIPGKMEGLWGQRSTEGSGVCPLQPQRQTGKVCRLVPVMSQSSLGWVNQRPLRLVNRCQPWEIGQWILHGPACPKLPRAEAKGPAGQRRGGYVLRVLPLTLSQPALQNGPPQLPLASS